MSNLSLSEIPGIPEISDTTFNDAIEKLSIHVSNKWHFRESPYRIATGANLVKKDFSGLSIRRSYYKDSIFDYVNFEKAEASGSMFINSVFNNCNFNYSSFDSCDFNADSETKVSRLAGIADNYTIKHAAFNKSHFIKSSIENVNFELVGFRNAFFENTDIKDTVFNFCVFENSIFKNCTLQNVRFRKLNLEFAEFDSVTPVNMLIPFASTPFIFGVFPIMKQTGGINVYSVNAEQNKLSSDQYLDLLPSLETYYAKTLQAFPLSNIYLSAENKQEQAISTVNYGIDQCIRTKNFRMLYYFIKLIYINNLFDKQFKKNVYHFICVEMEEAALDLDQLHKFSLYADEIENMLINSQHNIPTLQLKIQSNIDPKDEKSAEKTAYVIDLLDAVLEEFRDKDSICKIETSHDSDIGFLITLSQYLPEIQNFIEYITNIINDMADCTVHVAGAVSAVAGARLAIKKATENLKNITSDTADESAPLKVVQSVIKRP